MQSLDIQKRSATTTAAPQARHAADPVAKLIDISKCIGCKACQVACMQWNDLRDEIGTNVGVYDNPIDLTDQSWTVMRFSEISKADGSMEWLIRKDGCMHCEDPGCLKACPAPGAIVKYANGIVDFVSENCIGCGYCIAGCHKRIKVMAEKTFTEVCAMNFAECEGYHRLLAEEEAKDRQSPGAIRR
jgi:formate dehydrogenase iron-sulfur subunit